MCILVGTKFFQDFHAEINETSYKSLADFHWAKIKENPKTKNQKPNTKYQIPNPNNCHFPAPPISNLPFENNFYNLKHANLKTLTPSASRWLN